MPWARHSSWPSRRSSSNTRMKVSPMMFRFCSGRHPGQAREEALSGVDHHQVHPEVLLERRPQELGFLFAHEAVIDVDAGQAVTDSAWWASVAATAKSTPPDRAQMTLFGPRVAHARASIRDRISSTVEAMKLAGVQVGRARRSRGRSCGGCPVRPGYVRPRGGTGSRRACAPGRPTRRTASLPFLRSSREQKGGRPSGYHVRWLIHTGWLPIQPTGRGPFLVGDRDRERARIRGAMRGRRRRQAPAP